MNPSILWRKLKTFARKSWAARALFFEIYVRLGLARASVLTLPFKRLSRNWGVPHYEGLRTPHDAEERAFLHQLAWALRTASRYTPWNSNCLAQAITAKQILQRKGYDSTLYLGMMTPKRSAKGEAAAHAWLRCGDTWICGFRASRGFTVVGTFTETVGDAGETLADLPDLGETFAQLK